MIGQKIPAIDYSATIKKLNSLPENYDYKQLMSYAKSFNKAVERLSDVVRKTTEI
jgi:hypothetical protein